MLSKAKKLKKNYTNKPVLVAIFAHPDDESFGPGGTLYKFSQTHDVYIICATKGEVGGKLKDLSRIRANELLKSASILKVKKVFFLGFIDGNLSNSVYHDLASKIEKILKELRPEIIMTFEPRGVSGHIDHITVSMATAFVFQKLKFIKKLMYYCITDEKRGKFADTYFIYFPPGYKNHEIDEIIDVSAQWSEKVKAMKVHRSQKEDVKRVLSALEKSPKVEHFLIINN